MDTTAAVTTQSYNDIRNHIRSGDILLCSGNTPLSNMIKTATGSMWSHVAFILRLDVIDRILVLESVESIGVRAVPLRGYACDYNGSGNGYPGKVLLARHDDVRQTNMVNLSRRAIDLLGYPYNTQEILHIAARISLGQFGIKQTPDKVPEHGFICSEYAYVCFKSIGVTIDFNREGFIAPEDFAKSKRVQAISYIQTETTAARDTLSFA